jgi:hypothetical protein
LTLFLHHQGRNKIQRILVGPLNIIKKEYNGVCRPTNQSQSSNENEPKLHHRIICVHRGRPH